MEIRTGETRIVVLLPLLGLAIKFPKIHPFKAFGLFRQLMKRDNRWELLRKYWKFPPRAVGAFKYLLTRGILCNWQEFKFYSQTRNPLLHPTYFSLFGLLNIQAIGQPCGLKDVDLWCQLYELTEGKVFEDSHCFANPRNFCLSSGKLKITDYGSEGSQNVILAYGQKIYDLFDSSYCWEKEKLKHSK